MVTTLTDITPHVDAELRPALEATPHAAYDPANLAAVVALLRDNGAKRAARMPAPVIPAGMTIEDHTVPGPAGAPDISVRTYRPAGLRPAAPAFYWIHGGGMVMGTVPMSDGYCAGLADHLGALVASVDYRLAPQHPFPAPLEDCYAGLRWLHASAATLGIDPARIAIGGGSAGGGLAAGLALLARDRAEVPLCYQFLVYPMIDDRNATPSAHAITDTRVWNRITNLAGWHAYLDGRAGAPDVSPYAAPARATDLAGLPPAYINVGTLDLFVDEDIAYAQALSRAGVPVELHVYPGAYHGSSNLVPAAAISQRWLADERAALHRALNG
jgi:acetyl esterase/lipase